MMSPSPFDWLPKPTMSALEAALVYARHGLYVIPVYGVEDGRCSCGAAPGDCKPGKHPIGTAWQKGLSCIEDQIRDRFRFAMKRAAGKPINLGLAMGEQGDGSYLIAFDIDGEMGRARYAELAEQLGPLPATLAARSGRLDGGEHRILALGPEQDPKRIGNQAKLGLDRRVKGGQIVVCPSLHESGSRYTWANNFGFATLPNAWFEAIATPIETRSSPPPSRRNVVNFGDKYVEKVIEHAVQDIAAAGEGERNHRLWTKTCTVLEYCVGHGIAWETPLDQIRDAGRSCGLPSREVEETIRKSMRHVEKTGTSRHAPPPREPITHTRPVAPATPSSSSSPHVEPEPSEEELPEAAADETWRSLLSIDRGSYENCLANVITILSKHPEWEGVLQYDLFQEAIVFTREPPGRAHDRPMQRVQGNVWTETDTLRTQAWIRQFMGFEPGKMMVIDAVMVVADRAAVHPIRDYLGTLMWDGEERLPTMLANYFGAPVSAYTAGIGTCWMISAIARVMKPGCQVDYMLVLEGDQGLGKSSGVRALLPDSSWFSDTGIVIGQKDSYLTLHGCWIFSFDELDSLRGNEVTKTKSFLTSTRDRLRPPYGRQMRDFPRQNIFVGTTNEKEYFRDRTGNRRFWPSPCTRIDTNAIRRDRDQLWAEARVRYERGEKWWPDRELEALCKEEQAERMSDDPWIVPVSEWLRSERARAMVKEVGGVTTHAVLVNALSFQTKDIKRFDENRVAEVLKELDWKNSRRRQVNGSRLRLYSHVGQVGPEVGHDNH